MERVRFNNCLNKHVRFWNISIGSIVGGISFGLIILCFKGVLWSFAGGAIGFAVNCNELLTHYCNELLTHQTILKNKMNYSFLIRF